MKYNKAIIGLFIIVLIISFSIGASYAYFSVRIIGNDTASSQVMTSGSLKLTFNGTNKIVLDNIEPGDNQSKTFTVKNTGTVSVDSYQIYFSKLLNNFINNELVYTLTCVSSDAVSCTSKTETVVPTVEELALNSSTIAPGTTHTYTLNILFKETGSDQDYNQNKQAEFFITINEQQTRPVLMAQSSSSAFWVHKANITSVTFEDSVNVPVEIIAANKWDVSVAQDGRIMAYIIDDGLGTSTYKLYIQSDGEILANMSCTNLFYGFSKVTNINGINLFNTSKVTDMSAMFSSCRELTSLDLSSFDTSSVINMYGLFEGCYKLTDLNIDNFNTSKVTSMQAMFNSCYILANLDVSMFDTTKVTSMSSMFAHCSKLTNVDVSSFSTGQVTSFGNMFFYCSKLTNIDVSSFNTKNAVNMGGMFLRCDELTNLNLLSFNTEKVVGMSSMFMGCKSLASLELKTFNTAFVDNMSEMFRECSSLVSLNISSFNTVNVTSMYNMFNGCSSLTSVDLKGFNTSKVTNMQSTFKECSGLITLNVGTFNTSNVTTMKEMFSHVSSITNLDISNFSLSKVVEMSSMFSDCAGLVDLNIQFTNFKSSINLNLSEMFKNCISLVSLDCSRMPTSRDAMTQHIFQNCTSLTNLDIRGWSFYVGENWAYGMLSGTTDGIDIIATSVSFVQQKLTEAGVIGTVHLP